MQKGRLSLESKVFNKEVPILKGLLFQINHLCDQ